MNYEYLSSRFCNNIVPQLKDIDKYGKPYHISS